MAVKEIQREPGIVPHPVPRPPVFTSQVVVVVEVTEIPFGAATSGHKVSPEYEASYRVLIVLGRAVVRVYPPIRRSDLIEINNPRSACRYRFFHPGQRLVVNLRRTSDL